MSCALDRDGGYLRQLAPKHDAPQHRPRPLPLFLDLVRDLARTDPALAAAALAGLERYQQAPRRPADWPAVPGEAIGRARLYRYADAGIPVLLVPSIINPPFVLDLAADNSLARWLARRGFAVHLLDWGTPGAEHRDETLAAHVEAYLLPAMQRLGGDVRLVGHCLGGTLALAAAAIGEARGVATLAAPWDFSAYPDARRADLAALWEANRSAADRLGVVPVETLQPAFWSLDPQRTAAKFARLADRAMPQAAFDTFVLIEDWANGGAPLPFAAGRDLFEAMIGGNAPQSGSWTVAGRSIPARIEAPASLHFRSTGDRIVPAAAIPDFGRIVDNASGHIGMVVGRDARRAMWQPLADWLADPR
ncbi:MAG: alpha/beta hydrolase [Sphingomonadales bacterium]|nr:alpha/beta hydrolase [Sphingomonadales bacterium]